ncbi:MAG: U32 family peptidase [Thermogutta sp.]
MEILAPASDFACLEAAIRAGADAVYFGLPYLNARRRAKNFSVEEAARAVALLHAHQRKAFLTLNTDISYRELGLALATLGQGQQLGFDAVLVRDPALMAMRPAYPQIAFHFSTQTAIANSADVAAARELGANRVVLARELDLDEIRAACAVPGIDIEVFAHGALCFSISGRCLMSSWVGGRSGNRGVCASPCRVPWRIDGEPAGHPLSMHDLCALEHLSELQLAGVAALKIEGRLKPARWVEKAVEIYRAGLNQTRDLDSLIASAKTLTDYAGRELTDGFIVARREMLTGTNRGRVSRDETAPEDEAAFPSSESLSDESGPESGPSGGAIEFRLEVCGPRIRCSLEMESKPVAWEYPKTVVRRVHKALSAGELCQQIAGRRFQGVVLDAATTDDSDFLIVPRTANAIFDRITTEIGRIQRAKNRPLEINFPPGSLVSSDDLHPVNANNRHLGDEPNRVRLSVSQLEDFVEKVTKVGVIVEDVTPEDVANVAQISRKNAPVIALPPVFFEQDIGRIEELINRCKKARIPIEVNTWGGWLLARRAGIAFETGPGLGVLNPVAATYLRKLGARCVTISVEADRRQIEDICAHASVGLSLCVMGRPPLAISRVELPADYLGKMFADRRDLRMIPKRQWGLWVFRPEDPFDWRILKNDRICVRNLVVDLVGSPDPVGEWSRLTSHRERRFYFNYNRVLQ